jgi:hypothetical protein
MQDDDYGTMEFEGHKRERRAVGKGERGHSYGKETQ